MLRKLFVADVKMILRNRQTLFWSLVFPVIFITVFGLFNLDETVPAKIGFVDKAVNEFSEDIKESLSELEILEITDRDHVDSAKEELENGDLDFVLVVPEDFIFPVAEQQTLELFSDPTNLNENQIVKSTLEKFADEATLASIAVDPTLVIKDTEISSREIRYIDFLTPGIIGQSVMFSAVVGIAIAISRYREQNVLKRIRATPLNTKNFFLAEVGARLILAMVQTSLVIVVAQLVFDVQIFGSLFWIYAVALLGNLVFLQVGFFVAGVVKTATAAEGLSNVITLPLLFLSGVFIDTATLPRAVFLVVEHLPLAPLIKILRGIALHGDLPWEYQFELGLLAAWALVMFAIAWMTFRFERGSE